MLIDGFDDSEGASFASIRAARKIRVAASCIAPRRLLVTWYPRSLLVFGPACKIPNLASAVTPGGAPPLGPYGACPGPSQVRTTPRRRREFHRHLITAEQTIQLVEFFDDPSDPAALKSRELTLGLLLHTPFPFSRHQFAPGHITATGLVIAPDGERLLLVHHKRLNRWLLPGRACGRVRQGTRIGAAREVGRRPAWRWCRAGGVSGH